MSEQDPPPPRCPRCKFPWPLPERAFATRCRRCGYGLPLSVWLPATGYKFPDKEIAWSVEHF